MGQKTHPVGFRLGVIRGWSSKWYSEKDFSKWLHEDLRLKKFVKQKLGHAGVSSVEVEDVLYKHPAVLFAAVVAKPDPKWGEVPWAFVELKSNVTATEADMLGYCREHLPGFKSPKAVVFGELPKTSTGKIQKFVLRDSVGSAKAIST